MFEKNKENAIEFMTGDQTATVSFTAPKYVNKIKKLYQNDPKDFEAYRLNKDGSIYARIPLKWVKISKPRKTNLTEEQKAAMAERMKNSKQKMNEKIINEDLDYDDD